jgi:hypothetical protein
MTVVVVKDDGSAMRLYEPGWDRVAEHGLTSFATSSLDETLTTVAPSVGERTLVLSPTMCEKLGIRPVVGKRPDEEWPTTHVWESGNAAGPWRTYRAGRVTIHVLATIRMDEKTASRYPILTGTPAEYVNRLREFRRLTGLEYRGTPGIAGLALVRGTAARSAPSSRQDAARGARAPLWRYSAPIRVWEPEESAFKTSQRPHTGTRTFDMVNAYLAAAGSAELARDGLKRGIGDHTGSDWQKMAGWWLVDPTPWPIEEFMPPPWGSAHSSNPGLIWVTTRTRRLMEDLTEQGAYGGYAVREHYVAPGRRILRKWAESISGSLQAFAADEPLTATFKAVYREAIGLMNREGGSVYRPDWHYAIVAGARCTMWTAAYRIGHVTQQWPIRWSTDALTYCADSTARIDFNLALPIGDRLGMWREKNNVDA